MKRAFGNQAWTGFLGLFVLALLMLLVWGAGRGVYMLDETYYPFMIQAPERYAITVTGVGYILHALFGWMDPGIVEARMIAIGLSLLGTVLFFLGFAQWYQKVVVVGEHRFWNGSSLLLFLLVGALASCFLDWRSVSYNTLNNALLLAAGGGLLAYLATDAEPQWKRRKTFLALAGLAIGLDFVVKFPTAVLLTVFAGLLMLGARFSARRPWGCWACETGFLALGIVAGLLIYFVGVQSPAAWQAQFPPLMTVTAKGVHTVDAVLKSHVQNVFSMLLLLLRYGWLPVVWLLGMLYAKKRGSHLTLPLMVLLPVVILCTIFWAGLHRPTETFIKGFWLLLALGGVWGASQMTGPFSEWKAQPVESLRKYFPLLAGLLLLLKLPGIGAFGTGVSLLAMMYVGLVPWFALLACLVAWMASRGFRVLAGTLAGLTLVLVTMHGWFGLLNGAFTPMRKSLLVQTETVPELSNLQGLRIDAETKDYFLKMKQVLNQAGFHPGDPVLTYAHIPGLVYILGGMPYGGGYYMQGAEYEIENCFFVSQNKDLHAKRPFILLLDSVTTDFTRCLQEQDIYLDRDYEPAGEINLPPYFDYWDDRAQTLIILRPR